MLPSNKKNNEKKNIESRIWILLKQKVPGILGLSWRNRDFELLRGDKALKSAGKLVFLGGFDILCREIARFWPIGLAGQELNYFWRLML